MILHRIFGGEASLKISVWEMHVVDVRYTECEGAVVKDTGLGVCVLLSRFASVV